MTTLDTKTSLDCDCAITRAGSVNRNTADVPPSQFDLAGVETCPQPQPDLRTGRAESQCTSDRAAGPIEGRQNAVAGAFHQSPVMLLDHLLRELVVTVQHPTPALVTHRGRAARGIHDIGKQDRGEDPLKLSRRTRAMAGDKFLDVAKNASVSPEKNAWSALSGYSIYLAPGICAAKSRPRSTVT